MSKPTEPSIVFCHGIWADGSCFNKVIPALHPDLQRFVAKRMGATIVETSSSHVIMLSQPDLVVDVIRKAAIGSVT
jgi:hypothetical protein